MAVDSPRIGDDTEEAQKRIFHSKFNALQVDSSAEQIQEVFAMLKNRKGIRWIVEKTRQQCVPLHDYYRECDKARAFLGALVKPPNGTVCVPFPRVRIVSNEQREKLEEAKTSPAGDAAVTDLDPHYIEFFLNQGLVLAKPKDILFPTFDEKASFITKYVRETSDALLEQCSSIFHHAFRVREDNAIPILRRIFIGSAEHLTPQIIALQTLYREIEENRSHIESRVYLSLLGAKQEPESVALIREQFLKTTAKLARLRKDIVRITGRIKE